MNAIRPCVAKRAGPCELHSRGRFGTLVLIGTAGQSYLIRVGGFTIHVGAGTLTVYCSADFNFSGAISVQDLFDFLAAWFAHDPRADFNGVNSVSVQDLFDFLAAWFAGC